jgi:putative ABC transport system permease protein
MIVASISIALIASTNTILITTFERIPDFTIILAIGTPRTTVFLSILIEGLILSIISSFIGIILGIISTVLVTSSIQQSLNISIPLMASITVIINQISLISVIIGLSSSIIPAYIASTINIQENIRIV